MLQMIYKNNESLKRIWIGSWDEPVLKWKFKKKVTHSSPSVSLWQQLHTTSSTYTPATAASGWASFSLYTPLVSVLSISAFNTSVAISGTSLISLLMQSVTESVHIMSNCRLSWYLGRHRKDTACSCSISSTVFKSSEVPVYYRKNKENQCQGYDIVHTFNICHIIKKSKNSDICIHFKNIYTLVAPYKKIYTLVAPYKCGCIYLISNVKQAILYTQVCI